MNTDKCPLTWEEIEVMPTGAEKCQMLLSYASDAMHIGDDYKAVRALSEAIVQVSWKNPGTNISLLDQAYKGLCALSLSSDECTFEIASQAAGDYRRFVENNNDDRP